MKRVFCLKPHINKKNNQISIYLPRNKTNLFDNKKVPSKIKFEIQDIEWLP